VELNPNALVNFHYKGKLSCAAAKLTLFSTNGTQRRRFVNPIICTVVCQKAPLKQKQCQKVKSSVRVMSYVLQGQIYGCLHPLGHGKSMKNALHVQRYGKRHLSS